MTNLTQQTAPEQAQCPECGSLPEPDPRHNLSAMGYLHDDIPFECSGDGCDRTWTHGVPVGEYDGPLTDSLGCDVCGAWGLVHRVIADSGGVTLHMKCPECYYFWHAEREPDGNGVALVGYPQITGVVTAETDPYGYQGDVS